MRGDVRQRADWLAALDGIDGIIHLAAYQDYMPDFSTFHHVNTVGAHPALRADCRREVARAESGH